MIKTADGWVPGTDPSKALMRLATSYVMPEGHIALAKAWSDGGWKSGEGIVIIGPPKSGKTLTAMAMVQDLLDEQTVIVWNERDYIADQRTLWRLEETSQRASGDMGAWKECSQWEQAWHSLRSAPVLLFDDVGQAHTPNQRYEVEQFLRWREEQGLSTVATVDSAAWTMLSSRMKSVLLARSFKIELADGGE